LINKVRQLVIVHASYDMGFLIYTAADAMFALVHTLYYTLDTK
jgi:hypothetical protein